MTIMKKKNLIKHEIYEKKTGIIFLNYYFISKNEDNFKHKSTVSYVKVNKINIISCNLTF